MVREVLLYGLKKDLRPVPLYCRIPAGSEFDIDDLRRTVEELTDNGAVEIFMIANFHGLRGCYVRAQGTNPQDIVLFKNVLEKDGIKLSK